VLWNFPEVRATDVSVFTISENFWDIEDLILENDWEPLTHFSIEKLRMYENLWEIDTPFQCPKMFGTSSTKLHNAPESQGRLAFCNFRCPVPENIKP
jgi:hypothetical protein